MAITWQFVFNPVSGVIIMPQRVNVSPDFGRYSVTVEIIRYYYSGGRGFHLCGQLIDNRVEY